MTKQQAARRANIIIDSAVEFLAQKHNTTAEAVTAALEAGNKKLMEQFSKLVSAGLATSATI